MAAITAEPLQTGRLETMPPVVPWDSFYEWFARNWHQGEHVTIIGPTGEGKTLLSTELIRIPRFVVAFGTKGRDTTLERLIRDDGYYRLRTWTPDVSDHVVLWPPIKGAGQAREQQRIFQSAIDGIYRSGGWTVLLDEVSYMSDFLKLDTHLKFLLNQSRSSGISVVGATQRPAFIPLAFYDQASHYFVFKDEDSRNTDRLAEISGFHRRDAAAMIRGLEHHQFLYRHKHTGTIVRSKVEV